MDFKKWEPVYEKILEDFEFSREDDENSATLLSHLLVGPTTVDTSTLEELISGKDALVCGNAPKLEIDLKEVNIEDYVIIAADGATAHLMDNGIVPHIIVTDLDGDVEKEIEANQQGSIMVVHAHGDNTEKLLRYVPQFKNVIGTTQAEPFANIHNFGGFTDGDRCVFLAHEFNAKSITLVGFDFYDKNVTEMKEKKLKWAQRLLGAF
ncbi:6-hydroxymethylpterin diphosphokinase MptE-like protein [Methanococcoides sp. LMO-2]|uniref:6-hydroxymethyl-7,8-dihydropterin pyrophosphokinase n=1 Tax=Methanococcoides cohabitans TaxID=3136559 RepID=A0ABU9KRF2_9EURY